LAAEARESGAERQMSRRPSPSPSTAVETKVAGMNWVCPMAPAQEPRSWLRETSPEPIISRAAMS
jgi:hypothetical protein